MNLRTICYFFIVMGIAVLVNSGMSKVDPPNYNFSLDALQVFQPGSLWKDIQAKHKKGELIEDAGNIKTYKFYIAHIRYKFPLYVQIYKDHSLGFFAKLPSYFLHDIFHQSLINRYGKQDRYYKQEVSAIYEWTNNKGIRHIYRGSCTITCFPVYYAAASATPPKELGDFETILKKMTKFESLQIQ